MTNIDPERDIQTQLAIARLKKTTFNFSLIGWEAIILLYLLEAARQEPKNYGETNQIIAGIIDNFETVLIGREPELESICDRYNSQIEQNLVTVESEGKCDRYCELSDGIKREILIQDISLDITYKLLAQFKANPTDWAERVLEEAIQIVDSLSEDEFNDRIMLNDLVHLQNQENDN